VLHPDGQRTPGALSSTEHLSYTLSAVLSQDTRQRRVLTDQCCRPCLALRCEQYNSLTWPSPCQQSHPCCSRVERPQLHKKTGELDHIHAILIRSIQFMRSNIRPLAFEFLLQLCGHRRASCSSESGLAELPADSHFELLCANPKSSRRVWGML
jgi:hypothetical protein